MSEIGKGKKGPGRPAGSPNKATAEARQAIATFVDGNAHRLTEWLNRVADGVKILDPETGEDRWLVPPNPAKAFEMFQSVVEYHVPKLARMEHASDPDNPIKVQHSLSALDEVITSIRLRKQTEQQKQGKQ